MLMGPQETRNAGVKKLVAGYTGYAQQAALVNHWLNQVSACWDQEDDERMKTR